MNKEGESSDKDLHLLTLPREIRDQIWSFAFANQHLIPNRKAYRLSTSCEACKSFATTTTDNENERILSTLNHEGSEWKDVYPASLLTNHQIKTESSPFLFQDLTLYVSDGETLSFIKTYAFLTLRERLENLKLVVHLNSECRFTWSPILAQICPDVFPALRSLEVWCHMKPPSSYERLVRGIWILGPLLCLPGGLVPTYEPKGDPGEEEEEEQVKDDESEGEGEQKEKEEDTTDDEQDRSPEIQDEDEFKISESRTTLHFAYTRSEVLFDSPFLGEIQSADALEEHELVLRECLIDEDFKRMAHEQDLNGMAVQLLEIARGHEQRWLERLQSRRMRNLNLGDDDDDDDEEEQEDEEVEGESGEIEGYL